VLYLIPCRAGSKRLPGKNKRLFCGLPLWMWSWATAKRVMGPNDQCMVSSDDPEIYGITGDLRRHEKWCADESVVTEMIETLLVFDDVCLLQPTSPTHPDLLVRSMVALGGSRRSVTDGKPNGQCWIFRRGWQMDMIDFETERGADIDFLADFEAAEADMKRRFL